MAVVNRESMDGLRLIGTTEVLTSGEIYEKTAKMSLKEGMPKPKAAVLIKIDEIHSLKPGPMAGKKNRITNSRFISNIPPFSAEYQR